MIRRAPWSAEVAAGQVDAYLDAAHRGDGAAARATLMKLLDQGASTEDVVRDVLAVVQGRVGDEWLHDRWSVADEHLVSAVTQKALDAVASVIEADPPSTGPGTVVVVCPEGDWHSLPAQMFGELLRGRGLRVSFLGASTPADHLGRFLDRRRTVDAVVVSCAVPLYFAAVSDLVSVAHQHGVPVLAGGRAFGNGPRRAMALAADAWAGSLDHAVETLTGWALNPPTPQPERFRDEALLQHLEQTAPTAVEGACAAIREELVTGPGQATPDHLEQTVRFAVHFAVHCHVAGLRADDPTVGAEALDWLHVFLTRRGISPRLVADAVAAWISGQEDHRAAGRDLGNVRL